MNKLEIGNNFLFFVKKKVLTKSARCGSPQRSAFVNNFALTNFFQISLTYFDMVIYPKKVSNTTYHGRHKPLPYTGTFVESCRTKLFDIFKKLYYNIYIR